MAVYLLCYDLKNESGKHDYQVLWDYLKKAGAHRTQDSVWLIASTKSARGLHDEAKQYVDANDALWISEVLAGRYWYSNARAGTNDWLSKNPPRSCP